MPNKLRWIVYAGVEQEAEKKNQPFITDVYAEVSADAYQTVV